MKKFDVEITETLQRKVSVEAASLEDAGTHGDTQAWETIRTMSWIPAISPVWIHTGEINWERRKNGCVNTEEKLRWHVELKTVACFWSAAILKSLIHLRMKWPLRF